MLYENNSKWGIELRSSTELYPDNCIMTNAGQATRGNDLYLINLICDYTLLIALIE